MGDLNFDGKLNFSAVPAEAPDKILQNISKELKEVTNGYIVGILRPYDGPISTYIEKKGLSSIARSLAMDDVAKNIQEDLGKIGFESYKYEYYITTPSLDKYKYRMFFLQHSIGGYPVRMVLEQGIADEVFGQEDAEYVCEAKNEKELKNIVYNILQSKKAISVMQDLVNAVNFEQNILNKSLIAE